MTYKFICNTCQIEIKENCIKCYDNGKYYHKGLCAQIHVKHCKYPHKRFIYHQTAAARVEELKARSKNNFEKIIQILKIQPGWIVQQRLANKIGYDHASSISRHIRTLLSQNLIERTRTSINGCKKTIVRWKA